MLTAILYYLLIRPFEFEVNLKANTLPGDLIETIRIWNRSLDSAKVVEVDSFRRLEQRIVWKKRTYVYDWHFRMVNDSATQVNIQISEPGRGLINKVLIPFTNQAIERDANDIANQFYEILKVHLSITRVKIEGEAELDSSFCVCRPLQTTQIEKANGMMMDYSLLTAFIDDFKLKINGPPSVRVHEWDHSLGLLKFDFCFPIVETDSLPVSNAVIYKKFRGEKAIKAEYRGNYITSDRAWYALLAYAERNGYKSSGLPIEYFHDNPNLGMNEKNWKADVYLPVEDFKAAEMR
jgi:hypothetical protein